MGEPSDRGLEEPAGRGRECSQVSVEDSGFTRPSSGAARLGDSRTTEEERAVDAIRSMVKGGRVELLAPSDWPEGTEVLIEPTAAVTERIGIDESKWRDDPAALADWAAWIGTIEPLEYTPEEAASMAEFDERMRQYNIEAVRRQMQQGFGG
jgi:hypothetical protein